MENKVGQHRDKGLQGIFEKWNELQDRKDEIRKIENKLAEKLIAKNGLNIKINRR